MPAGYATGVMPGLSTPHRDHQLIMYGPKSIKETSHDINVRVKLCEDRMALTDVGLLQRVIHYQKKKSSFNQISGSNPVWVQGEKQKTKTHCKLRRCLHNKPLHKGLNNEATDRPAPSPHPIHTDPHNRFLAFIPTGTSFLPPPATQTLPSSLLPLYTRQTTSKDSWGNNQHCTLSINTHMKKRLKETHTLSPENTSVAFTVRREWAVQVRDTS